MTNKLVRNIYRLKDLLLIIEDKSINMIIYCNEEEIDYEDVKTYMDMYVVGFDFAIEDEQKMIIITISPRVEMSYMPAIFCDHEEGDGDAKYILMVNYESNPKEEDTEEE